MESIPITDFKAHCLSLMEGLHARGGEIIVTKRGKQFARVTPLGGARKSARGMLAGKATFRGDIVHVDWTNEFKASR